jgi:hypothetical protein
MTTVSYDRTGKLVSILCEKEKLLYPIEENTLESREYFSQARNLTGGVREAFRSLSTND